MDVEIQITDTHAVDVSVDYDVINHVQRRRLAFIADISPDGHVNNPKDRHLYLQALSDASTSAQQRITSNNQADDTSRDRIIIAEVMRQMAGNGGLSQVDQSESGTIPTPPKRLTDVPIDPGILDKETRQDTCAEFMERNANIRGGDDDSDL